MFIIKLLLQLGLLIAANSQNIHKRFEYKYSFKGPYLAQKDNQVPFWTYSGNAIASEDNFRITPSLRSQKGQAWTVNPTNFEWWEVEFVFRVNGRGRLGADGLALWFTQSKGVEGPVFGSSDHWNGLGLFFDSFDNDNKKNNPYIMGMVNDGTKAYDHEHDGASQQAGGCLRDFRNKPFPVRARIEYFKNVLTVKIQEVGYDFSAISDEMNERLQEAIYSEGSHSSYHNTHFLELFGTNIPKCVTCSVNVPTEEPHKQMWDIPEVSQDRTSAFREFESNVSITEFPVKTSKKKQSKSKRKKKKKRVFIHNGMTNNDKDYEICFRAENVFLPSSGHFGVTAATGGLADDHDVLKFLVSSLRSQEEMAQMMQNKEEEERFYKEFEQYQQKTQQAKADYIAQHPDAAKRPDDEEYETSEQRELRQIFQGQSQIYDIIRQLHVKLDEVVGRQERTLGLVSAIQNGGQVAPLPAGQVPPAPQPGYTDSIRRHEVDSIMNNQREMIQSARELKSFVSDIQQKSQQLLHKSQQGQGSAQPVGGYDFHVTLKEINEGLNVVKRDLGMANQRLGGGQAATGGCPTGNCLSTSIFVVFMIFQSALLLCYFWYRDSKEAQAKKFY